MTSRCVLGMQSCCWDIGARSFPRRAFPLLVFYPIGLLDANQPNLTGGEKNRHVKDLAGKRPSGEKTGHWDIIHKHTGCRTFRRRTFRGKKERKKSNLA